MIKGICPVCGGTCRVPVPEDAQEYKKVIAGYDKVTDTFPCSNCGGQYMMSHPTGEVPLRPDGTPCKHEYTSETVRNCYHKHICKHCGDTHFIDSGD